MIVREPKGTRGLGRTGAVDAALPLMVAAVVLVGVFLFWLSRASEPDEVELTETPTASETMGSMAREVALTAYAANPGSFAGGDVQISGITVSAIPNGTTGIFWVQEGGLLLFRLDDAVMAGFGEFAVGDAVTVTGTVAALDDAALDAWIAAGRAEEDARLELGFADVYFGVTSIERVGAPAGGAGGAAAPGGEG